jgi:hypothetical protein
MSQPGSAAVSGAVEGPVDEAVLKRLIEQAGGIPGVIHGKRGKDYLRSKLRGFNLAARFSPWVVLVDLNHEAECAPRLRQSWRLDQHSPQLCFRIAVRTVEAWLLADRDSFAKFLGIASSRIPKNPETESDPKETVVRLARRSRRRNIQQDMVPRPGGGREVGPAYSSRLIEFIEKEWNPERAALTAPSLARALKCIKRLLEIKK